MAGRMKTRMQEIKAMDAKDKRRFWKETLLNNSLYIFIVIAIIYIQIQAPGFLAPASIISDAFGTWCCRNDRIDRY